MQGNRRKSIEAQKLRNLLIANNFYHQPTISKIPIKVGFERRRCKDVGFGFRV
jgi:hypothetical protein